MSVQHRLRYCNFAAIDNSQQYQGVVFRCQTEFAEMTLQKSPFLSKAQREKYFCHLCYFSEEKKKSTKKSPTLSSKNWVEFLASSDSSQVDTVCAVSLSLSSTFAW